MLLLPGLAVATGQEKPGEARFQSWVALRDAGVVRQRRDFSCGLASLATLLTHYYRIEVGEEALLDEVLSRGSVDRVTGSSVSYTHLRAHET